MDKRIIAALALVLAQSASGATPTSNDTIARELKSELETRQNVVFGNLLSHWENKYGTQAVPPLLTLASNIRLEDAHRYVALMGAAKIGGLAIAPSLVPFLRDNSWMLRTAALRALGALQNPVTAAAVLPLIHDKALLVRSEAIEAIVRLKPVGAVEELISALEHSQNYHGGRAQMVPQKALAALAALGTREIAPRLCPLLRHAKDPELQAKTIDTLERLTGEHLIPEGSLEVKIKAWEAKLAG